MKYSGSAYQKKIIKKGERLNYYYNIFRSEEAPGAMIVFMSENSKPAHPVFFQSFASAERFFNGRRIINGRVY